MLQQGGWSPPPGVVWLRRRCPRYTKGCLPTPSCGMRRGTALKPSAPSNPHSPLPHLALPARLAKLARVCPAVCAREMPPPPSRVLKLVCLSLARAQLSLGSRASVCQPLGLTQQRVPGRKDRLRLTCLPPPPLSLPPVSPPPPPPRQGCLRLWGVHQGALD